MPNRNVPENLKELPFSPGFATDHCLYVSGQGGIDASGKIVGPDIESQTITTMTNIRSILLDYQLDFKDIIKTNVYLSNRSLYQAFNAVYARFFQAPFPARTTIYCDLNYGLLVEIDAIAALPDLRR